MGIKADLRGALVYLDQIEATSTAAVRPAAQEGAQVLYDEVRRRTPVGRDGYFHGTQYAKDGTKYFFSKGNLRNAIYQAFSRDNSRPVGGGYERATYHVSWNAKKAPYGGWVERGYWRRFEVIRDPVSGRFTTTKKPLASPVWVPGKAFVRGSAEAVPRATEAMKARWLSDLAKIGVK